MVGNRSEGDSICNRANPCGLRLFFGCAVSFVAVSSSLFVLGLPRSLSYRGYFFFYDCFWQKVGFFWQKVGFCF